MKRSLLCAFVLTLTACVSVGRHFATTKVGEIQIGETTRERVEELFGPPWRTGLEDGDLTWTYGRYEYALFQPARTADLLVRFDERGIVTAFSFSSTSPEP